MQINSIADNGIQKKQQVISNSGLHFKQALSNVRSDKASGDTKENALQKAFINWRSEYISGEGGLKHLLSSGHSQIINNDEFVGTGTEQGWSFPPRNAPMAVHNAWDECMEGLSQEERLLASGRFLGVNLEGNIKPDGSGFYEPEDKEYNNQFTSADYSYRNLIGTMLSRTEEFSAQTSTEQFEQDKKFFDKLLETFSRYQVA